MGLQSKEPHHLTLQEKPLTLREDLALQEEKRGDTGEAKGAEAALA